MTAADELVSAGRLERVPADPAAALSLLQDARRHLEAAGSIADIDPNGAYQLAYDAARKAAVAHMLNRGLRVANRPGAHEATARYAADALLSESSSGHLDRMRRFRNRSEYGVAHFDARVVEADLEHARAIVDAVAREVSVG